MESLPKIYLTAGLIMNMAITNYCYNTYGLSPDYNFFRTQPAAAVQSVAGSGKARFISNYTPMYDNIISSMAVEDDIISTGALYFEYRESFAQKIYIGGIHVQVPDTEDRFAELFRYEPDADYAGGNDSGKLYIGDEQVAAVRVKKGMVYRLSSSSPEMKIAGIGVGAYVLDVIRIWGEPQKDDDGRILQYNSGTDANITLIISPDGYVTWMLYEGMKTELIDDPALSESTTEGTTDTVSAARTSETPHPVAEAVIMQNHGKAAKKESGAGK